MNNLVESLTQDIEHVKLADQRVFGDLSIGESITIITSGEANIASRQAIWDGLMEAQRLMHDKLTPLLNPYIDKLGVLAVVGTPSGVSFRYGDAPVVEHSIIGTYNRYAPLTLTGVEEDSIELAVADVDMDKYWPGARASGARDLGLIIPFRGLVEITPV